MNIYRIADAKMPPKTKFADGERVLCFHGPLIYEAKALKSSVTKDKQVKYFIHYAGWNKNWDEWVPENRVLKYNEANVQKQKEVSKLHVSLTNKNKKAVAVPKPKKLDGTSSNGKDSDSRASTPSKEIPKDDKTPATSVVNTSTGSSRGRSAKPTASTPVPTEANKETAVVKTTAEAATTKDDASNRKKRRIDTSAETDEQFLNKVEIKIKIPDELKPWLVDDWDAINRQQKLLEIPAAKTVKDIIDDYMLMKKSSKVTTQNKEVAITDVTSGLISYFNVMLGSQLLYKSERPQYSEILQNHPNTPMSDLYGSFHLLRLFVRLGSMLAFTSLDEKSVQLLLVNLYDFLKYLVKNSSTLFNMQHFVNVSPEYYRKTQ